MAGPSTNPARPTFDELVVGDEPEAWRSAGFEVDGDGTCRIGSVRVHLAGRTRGKGLQRWVLRGIDPAAAAGGIDGVPTEASDRPPPEPATHPNGARLIDHVVVVSPDGPRTAAAITAATGAEVRRVRAAGTDEAPMQQRFFRFGEVILELVSPVLPGDGPAHVWGLAISVDDIDALGPLLGEHVGPPRPAVQAGRRIATLRHRPLDISVTVAFMSSEATPAGR